MKVEGSGGVVVGSEGDDGEEEPEGCVWLVAAAEAAATATSAPVAAAATCVLCVGLVGAVVWLWMASECDWCTAFIKRLRARVPGPATAPRPESLVGRKTSTGVCLSSPAKVSLSFSPAPGSIAADAASAGDLRALPPWWRVWRIGCVQRAAGGGGGGACRCVCPCATVWEDLCVCA